LIAPGTPLDSMRDAVFTVSPHTSYGELVTPDDACDKRLRLRFLPVFGHDDEGFLECRQRGLVFRTSAGALAGNDPL
jgi:hypothetical protein